MYASVRKYTVHVGDVSEILHRVDTTFAARLEQMPGFVAYQAIDAGQDRTGEDRLFTVTICSVVDDLPAADPRFRHR